MNKLPASPLQGFMLLLRPCKAMFWSRSTCTKMVCKVLIETCTCIFSDTC